MTIKKGADDEERNVRASRVSRTTHPGRTSGTARKSVSIGANFETADQQAAIQQAADAAGESEAAADQAEEVAEENAEPAVVEDESWRNEIDVKELLYRFRTHKLDRYKKSCQELGIVPVSYFIERMDQDALIMKYHGLGPKGAQAIADVLEGNAKIRTFDMSYNHIAEGANHIGRMLTENVVLTHLDLSNNLIYNCKDLASALSGNSTLKSLILKGNLINDSDAESFGAAIRENSTLHELDLSNNKIGDLGIIKLGAGVAANTTLRILNVSWNEIRPKGAVTFLGALKDHVSLLSLSLGHNGFAEGAGAVLSQYLAKNLTVEALDISSARLNDDAVTAMSKGLEQNSSVRLLDISGNNFSDAGATALFKAAQTNSSLERLLIKGIKLTKEGRTKLDELRSAKGKLTVDE